LCVNDITSHELKHIYHAIRDRFPQLANEPNYSSPALKRRSPAFNSIWTFVVDMNSGRHADQVHLNALMHCDQEHLIQSMRQATVFISLLGWRLLATLGLGSNHFY
jgi:hypothetical protein